MNTRIRTLFLGALLCGSSLIASAQILYTPLSTPLSLVGAYPSYTTVDDIYFGLGLDETAFANAAASYSGPSYADGFYLGEANGVLLDAMATGSLIADVGGSGPTRDHLTMLTAGQSVEQAIASGSASHGGNGYDGANIYIGLETADGHYGWAQVDAGAGNLTLNGFAVNEVAGQDIVAGQTVSAVPEPRAWAWICGAACLALAFGEGLRRRKGPASLRLI